MDEAHQLDLTAVVPVASIVHFVLLLWDPAQRIIFEQQRPEKEYSPLDHEVFYPWPTAVRGCTMTDPWLYMRPDDIKQLRVSRRFGPETCHYLRKTCTAYAEGGGFCITSPAEEGHGNPSPIAKYGLYIITTTSTS